MSLVQIAVVGGMAAIAYIVMSGDSGNGGFDGGLGSGAGDEEETKEKDISKESLEPDPVFKTTSEISVEGKKGDVTASAALWESLFATKDKYGEPTSGGLATGDYSRPSGSWNILGPTHKDSPYQAISGVKKLAEPTAQRSSGFKLARYHEAQRQKVFTEFKPIKF